ncbi:MAG: LPP20 family lipoprotein [Candidatus Cloacimonetes bacterium]|nr:LPP20 family lipoprotein [Candidatus Cloacimonadota bacterium]MBT6994000.1 LPP20 family lipoprotein [Candidatus Cloacimonadota bacterium]MBT7470322.1 LPP20 family lipoprotein [Candidatus Cloacimonadota bacterium]
MCFAINPEIVKNHNSPYFYGESETEELDEAKDKALSNLSSHISITVSSTFENYAKEQNGNVTESCESIINTYSIISLRNLKPYQKPTSNGWYVLYYIHRDSLNIIYNERVNLIGDMYYQACEMEKIANLSGALQQYYYCLILMDSVPYSDIDFKGDNLRIQVPSAIRRILNNIEFVYEGDKKPQEDQRFVNFGVYYNNLPVSKLDFYYIEKNEEYKTVAKDGRAICQLTGASVNYTNLEIKIQYSFSSERSQYTIVDQLWRAVNRKRFPENQKKIDLKKERKKEKIKSNNPNEYKISDYTFFVENPDSCEIQENLLQTTANLLDALSSKKFSNIEKNKSFEEKLNSILKYNHPQLIDTYYPVIINKTYEGWELRRIPIYCNYPSLNKQTTEYAIFDFDEEGILIDINFSVFDQLYKTYVFENSNKEDKQHKQIIIKFIEKYRTAFLNRDIETIETIFADEAVIIVGKIKKAEKQMKDYQYQKINNDQPDINYIKMTKGQYLNRQKRIFSNQQDIHLGFNTFKIIRKSRECNIYGISMRQQYKSTGYADEGHLFLLIDFEEDEPMIYVRSWQPQEWRDDQLIELGNFRVLGK